MTKMPKDLQELLKLRGVTDSDLKIVHDYYNTIINEVAKGSVENKKKQHAEAEKNKQPNHTELAKEARIIK